MGFGEFPHGEGPCGESPVMPFGIDRPDMPRAIRFDGATRTFLYDANGRLVDVHPIDQEVSLAVLVELGKFAPSSRVGSSLRATPASSDGAALQADVDRRVRTALTRPLEAGDITIQSISVASAVRWRLSVTVRYFNNRIQGAPLRTVTNG